MPEEISLKHKIALGLIPRIGDINARKLVSHFGSVEAVFHESYRNLVKIPGIGSGLARYISDHSYLDNDYPFRLRQCDDSPVVFFFKGTSDLN